MLTSSARGVARLGSQALHRGRGWGRGDREGCGAFATRPRPITATFGAPLVLWGTGQHRSGVFHSPEEVVRSLGPGGGVQKQVGVLAGGARSARRAVCSEHSGLLFFTLFAGSCSALSPFHCPLQPTLSLRGPPAQPLSDLCLPLQPQGWG